MATLVSDPKSSYPGRTTLRPKVPTVAVGSATWPVVRIETEGATYVGQIYVPETKRRLSDVLADSRPFLHLVNVSINGGSEQEPFIALNKTYIRTVRVVDEGKASELVLVPAAR